LKCFFFFILSLKNIIMFFFNHFISPQNNVKSFSPPSIPLLPPFTTTNGLSRFYSLCTKFFPLTQRNSQKSEYMSIFDSSLNRSPSSSLLSSSINALNIEWCHMQVLFFI
jgi:hypothetical protein